MESEIICPVCNKAISSLELERAEDGKAVHSDCLDKYASEITRAETSLEEINDTLWSLGWQFSVMCFLAFIFAGTAIYASDSFYGAVASLVVIIPWHRGTRLINNNWNGVFNALLKKAEKTGADQLNINQDETEIFHLTHSTGRAVSVFPKRRYHLSLLYIGEKSLSLYDDAHIDMVNRIFIHGGNPKKLDYRDIASVDYVPPYFMVQTSSGDKLSYKSIDSDEEPALNAIRKKLRSVQVNQ